MTHPSFTDELFSSVIVEIVCSNSKIHKPKTCPTRFKSHSTHSTPSFALFKQARRYDRNRTLRRTRFRTLRSWSCLHFDRIHVDGSSRLLSHDRSRRDVYALSSQRRIRAIRYQMDRPRLWIQLRMGLLVLLWYHSSDRDLSFISDHRLLGHKPSRAACRLDHDSSHSFYWS